MSLKELLSTVDSFKLPPIGPGATAELLDEADENGTVVIRDAQGAARWLLPREDYDALRNWHGSSDAGSPENTSE